MIFDRSQDLYLTPHHHGVRLTSSPKHSPVLNPLTVGESLAYACNVYILNTDSEIQHVNESSLESCGHDSAFSLIGKSVTQVLAKHDARISMSDDRAVLTAKQSKLYEHSMTVHQASRMSCISAKAPLLDDNNQIIGLFGCTIILGKQSLTDSLELINRLSLIPTRPRQPKQSTSTFTTREQQILQHLICGMSAKMIADRLTISRRTVEHHIENMKSKLNCSSKYELINLYTS